MKNDLEIDIHTVNELCQEVIDYIRRTHDREFGNDSMIYAAPQWHIIGHLRDELVTRAGILQRTITVDNRPILIAGIGFLITEPPYRSRGFATELMKQAIAFVRDKLELPYALLTCKPELESLYSRMGWQTVCEPGVFVQPTGNRSCGGVIMVYELGEAPWPYGEIDFCGLPW